MINNDITAKDLNLLHIFMLLLEEGNLSRVAKKLNLTQPAVSRSLAKLRHEFADPLFVRASAGILPTPKALALEQPLRKVLDAAEALYKSTPIFNPAEARGVIRIATTDYFEQVIWLDIVARLIAKAPKLSFVTQMTGSEIPAPEMRDGSVNLAIAGFFKDLPPGFLRQELFRDEFKCVVRQDHPKIKANMDLEAFSRGQHLMVSPRGDLQGAVYKVMESKGRKRHVAVSVSSFLSSGPLVANSDLILTAPSLLVDRFAKQWPLKVFEPPIKLPKIHVIQVWHERFHQDPLSKWLRREIGECCRQLT